MGARQGDALREWRRVVKELGTLRVISKLDRSALAAYCSAYGRWAAATGALNWVAAGCDYGGLLIETSNGNLIQNPLFGIQRRAADDVVRYSAEFGLTPSSRTRLKVPNPNEEPNRFAKYDRTSQ